MSNWQFEEMGEFGDEQAANRWADRNRLDPRDVHVRQSGKGVKLAVRRSSLGDSGTRQDDLRDGRRDGW
ncbi:MAG: hypothetical protein ABW167_11580 [Baekduia sp.]